MKKILVLGGSGLVGSKFIELKSSQFEIHAPDAPTVDVLNKEAVLKICSEFKPEAVINFAAYTDVQKAEEQKDNEEGLCYQLNVIGARNVSEVCKDKNIKLIHLSTDYVFDGEKEISPYIEKDSPNPKNWYGQTKYLGEQAVLQSGCVSTIVRISMPFSSNHQLKKDVARFFLNQLQNQQEIRAINDQKITPVLVDDVANALGALIENESSGVYHVVSTDWTTPFDFATQLAKTFELDALLIKPITLDEYNQEKAVKLLRFSWLDCSKFEQEFGLGILHNLKESMALFKEAVDDSNKN